MTQQQTPAEVTFGERTDNLTALMAGKAVKVEPGETWLVEEGSASLEFDSEENARAYWLDNGGALVQRVETSWVLLDRWKAMAAKDAPDE